MCRKEGSKTPVQHRTDQESAQSGGTRYLQQGDFKAAEKCFEKLLSDAKDAGDKINEALVYSRLGSYYRFLCNPMKAIKFYHYGLDIAKEIGDKDLEGAIYTGLGISHSKLGYFKKALECHHHSLLIYKKAGNKGAEAAAYGNLSNAYSFFGDFKKALEYNKLVLSIAIQTGNKNLEGKAYVSLGNCFTHLKHLKIAMEYNQLGLDVAKQVGDKDLEGKTYLNLGNIHFHLSDFNKATENYQEGLSIVKQAGDKSSEGAAYSSLGLCYHYVGDFETAIKYHKKALKFTKTIKDKASEGRVYLNLGNAHYSLGTQKTEPLADELEKADDNCQQALCIAKQVEDQSLEARACSDLGLVHYSLRDYDKAIDFHKRNLSIARKIGIKDLEGAACLNLGQVYLSRSDPETAKASFYQALSIAKEIGNKLAEAKACSSLGTVYCTLNDVSMGEDFYKSSVRLLDETRSLLKSNDEWKIGFRNQHDASYRSLWHVQLQQDKTEEALATAEKGRAQALMDLLESEYGVKSALPESDEHISCVSKYLTSMIIFLGEASQAVNFWVLQNGQQCKFVRKEISDGLESLTHNAYKSIEIFKEIMCENRSSDEPADEESKECSGQNLEEKEFTPKEEEETQPLKVLFDTLIGPISHLIQGDELIIVPDTALFLVPYAALVDQHSKYLSETLKIRLVPTLTSIKLMAECPVEYHSKSGALLVGDPLLQNVPMRLSQLPAARQEVEMIGNILNITPLTGKNATKAAVLNKLNSVALVHIAAHGEAKTGEIILCPNPDGPQEGDYRLTMSDVLNIKLRAKLVVLSCCYSGRGKIKAEGVVGLARAFLGAGARSVLASLWAVHDQATLNFMKYFYEHLVRGQSAGRALDWAMKRMRDSDNFREIRHWAPFVLIGDDVTLNFGELR